MFPQLHSTARRCLRGGLPYRLKPLERNGLAIQSPHQCLVPSGPRWYNTSYRPGTDDSSARRSTAIGYADLPQFDATSWWTTYTQCKPHWLQCFHANVRASALAANLLPVGDDALHTGDGNLADDGYPNPYTFAGQASFFIFVDFIIYIFKIGQEEGEEAPEKGAI